MPKDQKKKREGNPHHSTKQCNTWKFYYKKHMKKKSCHIYMWKIIQKIERIN